MINKIKEFNKKYLTQRVRNIISIVIIIFGVIFMVNYTLYKPTYINKVIASKMYKTPANSAFTDQNFYNCIIDSYNSEKNASYAYTYNLTDKELSSLTELNCVGDKKSTSGYNTISSVQQSYFDKTISNVQGLEKLTGLTHLNLTNNSIKELDVSKNTVLTNLNISYNQLTTLDVSKNTVLTDLNISYNQLTTLDVSKNVTLTSLNMSSNQLTELDVSKNTSLTNLNVSSNRLAELNVNNNITLTHLNLTNNSVKALDISKNTVLTDLNISYNQLTTLDASKNIVLEDLWIDNNQLTSINLSNNSALENMNASQNELLALDISKDISLTNLDLSENQLAELDISENTALTILDISVNKLSKLDISKNTALTTLNVSSNQLTELSVSNNLTLLRLDVSSNKLTLLDVSKNPVLESLNVSSNKLTLIDIYWDPTMERRKTIISDNNTNIISFTSNKYSLDNSFIVEKNIDSIVPSFTCNGCTVSIINDKLVIKALDKVAKEFKIVIIDTKYDIIDNGIIIGSDYDNMTTVGKNIKVPSCDIELNNGYAKVSCNDEVIKEFGLIGYSSTKYDLSKNFIKVDDDNLLNDIKCFQCTARISNDSLVIEYNKKIVKQYLLLNINSKYRIIGDNIYVNDTEFNRDKFKCSISGIDLLDTDIVIADDMVNIKYNNEVIKWYNIINSDEYLEVNDGGIDNKNLLINNIKTDFDIESFKKKINSNVEYSIKDRDNKEILSGNIKTGDILFINYKEEPLSYVISVKGDVLGTGMLDINGAKKISTHIINKKEFDKKEYLNAADYDGNGVIKMNDVIKMLRDMKRDVS